MGMRTPVLFGEEMSMLRIKETPAEAPAVRKMLEGEEGKLSRSVPVSE